MRSCDKKHIDSLQSINRVILTHFTVSTNKLGQETAKRAILVSSYADLKRVHADDTTELGRLKKLVDHKTIDATIIENTTTNHSSGKTVVEMPEKKDTTKNTIAKLPCDTIYPVYDYRDSTKWQKIVIRATKDTTTVISIVHNEFDIKQSNIKQGRWPFRHTVPEISILNKNPNTKTTELISYHVDVPKKRPFIIAGISALAGFMGAFILLKH